ncbi:MAG TPA: hypothetical protein VG895_04955 [Patescibacteria group bacterium]|nr:hypothetical protein [Patescibacteria group bacterium]
MKKTFFITLISGLLILSPTVVLAQTPTATNNRITIVKQKADAEIERRLTSLTNAISLVNGFKKLNDSQKTNFVTSINTQISDLNNLKTKIDADTDMQTLRADQKSIFDEYRIYMLYLPQTRILSAAERESETIDLMNQVSTKIAGRINGNANLQNTLNDANTKLTDATTQETNATNLVINLAPDQGNTATSASNTAALKSARADLQTALKDLQTAKTDFQTIINQLKTQGTSSPTATP